MKVKIALIAAMLSSGIIGLWAQDQVEAHLGADIVSDYIWRGQDFGNVSLPIPPADISTLSLASH